MELSKYSLDLILVPLSLCLTIGYHVFLWHRFNNRKSLTTTRARVWIPDIIQDPEKGLLGVQSLRNSLMTAILASSLAILLNSALAALANNTYNASRNFRDLLLGSHAEPMLIIKYASTSVFLLFSFVCSSLAVGCLNEVNFLINASGDLSPEYVQAMVERGCIIATVGNRVLYIAVPMLLWMMGPVPLALSSIALVWVLYLLDQPNNGFKEDSSE